MAAAREGSWPNERAQYKLEEVIGYGSTGVVQAATCIPRNKRVAIKRIGMEKSFADINDGKKELYTMSLHVCKHKNIVSYYTKFVVKQELWIVMKLLNGGSMLDVINHQKKKGKIEYGVLDEAVIAVVLREVLKGLWYFHKQGLVHRDIKASNILLATDGTVQLADFGVSSVISDCDGSTNKVSITLIGTPCWMAPEVMDQFHGYNHKADIWSFGITAIELATGIPPYANYPPTKVVSLTLKYDPPTLDTVNYKKNSKEFRNMINMCLQKDPDMRPSAKELLKQPFFKKAKEKGLLAKLLVPLMPPLEQRSQKVKRVSGSLHRAADGSWEWSDDDEDEHDVAKEPVPKAEGSDVLVQPSTPIIPKTLQGMKLDITLTLRNPKKELNNIRFDFIPGIDTPEGVAQELVSAGLISGQDLVVVAANLQKVIDNPPNSKSMMFPLKSSSSLTEPTDDRTLVEFAQLTINS